MSFFDKKEDVIDLVLTRKGRELLSKGKFIPTHYAFYDDEVIYDQKYADPDSGEKQNEIVPRIKDSLYIKNQNEWHAAVRSERSRNNLPNLLKELGKSSTFKKYKPAWQVDVVEGIITGSTANGKRVEHIPLEYSGSNQQYEDKHIDVKIPQLNLICDYDIHYLKGSEAVDQNKVPLFQDPEHTQVLMLRKTSDDIILEIIEENAEDTKDNFKLEVFEYIYGNPKAVGTKQRYPVQELNKKFFSSEKYGEEFVEYFFNVETDDEVDNKVAIKYIDNSDIMKTSEEDICVTPEKAATITAAPAIAPAAAAAAAAPPPPLKAKVGSKCAKNSDCASEYCGTTKAGLKKCMLKTGGKFLCKSNLDCPAWAKCIKGGCVLAGKAAAAAAEEKKEQTFEKAEATEEQVSGKKEYWCKPGTPAGQPGGCDKGYKCIDTDGPKGTCEKIKVREQQVDDGKGVPVDQVSWGIEVFKCKSDKECILPGQACNKGVCGAYKKASQNPGQKCGADWHCKSLTRQVPKDPSKDDWRNGDFKYFKYSESNGDKIISSCIKGVCSKYDAAKTILPWQSFAGPYYVRRFPCPELKISGMPDAGPKHKKYKKYAMWKETHPSTKLRQWSLEWAPLHRWEQYRLRNSPLDDVLGLPAGNCCTKGPMAKLVNKDKCVGIVKIKVNKFDDGPFKKAAFDDKPNADMYGTPLECKQHSDCKNYPGYVLYKKPYACVKGMCMPNRVPEEMSCFKDEHCASGTYTSNSVAEFDGKDLTFFFVNNPLKSKCKNNKCAAAGAKGDSCVHGAPAAAAGDAPGNPCQPGLKCGKYVKTKGSGTTFKSCKALGSNYPFCKCV